VSTPYSICITILDVGECEAIEKGTFVILDVLRQKQLQNWGCHEGVAFSIYLLFRRHTRFFMMRELPKENSTTTYFVEREGNKNETMPRPNNRGENYYSCHESENTVRAILQAQKYRPTGSDIRNGVFRFSRVQQE
jgi:hypothetical protein